jgi:hypothetical protein
MVLLKSSQLFAILHIDYVLVDDALAYLLIVGRYEG